MPSFIKKNQSNSFHPPPVVIGGVGGSGTRLIAAILAKLDFYMGNDLNKANDNLAFTLLFKQKSLWPLTENREAIQQSIAIFLTTMYLGKPLGEYEILRVKELAGKARLNAPEEWLQERAEKLINFHSGRRPHEPWGWKEPNTHIFLPALLDTIKGMKYIHVMRHGLDMAYSANQAQVKLWSKALTGRAVDNVTPRESFHYWCAAHRRVLDLGSDMGADFLLLNFDKLCLSPDSEMRSLLAFLDISPGPKVCQSLIDMVRRPASIGRHKDMHRLDLDPSEIDLLERLGFAAY